jgi:type IV secretory pathway VirB3-like protein
MLREGSTRPPHVVTVNYKKTYLDVSTWGLVFFITELCWTQKLLSSLYHLYGLRVNWKEQNIECFKYEDVKGSDVVSQIVELD